MTWLSFRQNARTCCLTCSFFPATSASITRVDDWKRLGRYVRRAREEMGYTSRDAFEAAVKTKDTDKTLSARRLGDLERGYPVGEAFLSRLETALDWAPGSAQEVLAGGEPTLLPRYRRDVDVRPGVRADVEEGEDLDAVRAAVSGVRPPITWERARDRYETARHALDEMWAMIERLKAHNNGQK